MRCNEDGLGQPLGNERQQEVSSPTYGKWVNGDKFGAQQRPGGSAAGKCGDGVAIAAAGRGET